MPVETGRDVPRGRTSGRRRGAAGLLYQRRSLEEPIRPHVPCPVCEPRGRTSAALAVHEGPAPQRSRAPQAESTAKPLPIAEEFVPRRHEFIRPRERKDIDGRTESGKGPKLGKQHI